MSAVYVYVCSVCVVCVVCVECVSCVVSPPGPHDVCFIPQKPGKLGELKLTASIQ